MSRIHIYRDPGRGGKTPPTSERERVESFFETDAMIVFCKFSVTLGRSAGKTGVASSPPPGDAAWGMNDRKDAGVLHIYILGLADNREPPSPPPLDFRRGGGMEKSDGMEGSAQLENATLGGGAGKTGSRPHGSFESSAAHSRHPPSQFAY